MWVVPVFSVSLFPSSSVFWLNYDCNELLNYNIGPKEQEMIFKDRINFLIIFGCNSPVCLSVYLSAATLGQLVEREGWRANKKLTIVVCFYLFVRLFAFSSRNLVAPFWSLQNPRIEELMKLTGTFQRLHRLSCFLFVESGSCLQSPSLSASSCLSSKFYEERERERAASCFVSWHWWLNRRIRWGRLWRKLSYSVLLLPPFSTRASVSPHLTLHQHHHAIGPIPRFHLISVACSTGFGKICSTRLEKTINITKLSWSITLYHCIPLQKVEFFIQRVNDARMLVALGDWWNLYLFAACQSPGWSMSLMFNS